MRLPVHDCVNGVINRARFQQRADQLLAKLKIDRLQFRSSGLVSRNQRVKLFCPGTQRSIPSISESGQEIRPDARSAFSRLLLEDSQARGDRR
jgi:hypothetical protein